MVLKTLLLAIFALAASCAAPPPSGPSKVGDDDPPPIFGVEVGKLAGEGNPAPRVTVNGSEVSREEAIRRLDLAPDAPRPTAPTLPDRSGRLHLTVIGPPAERAVVLRDLDTHPALQPVKGRLVVRDYDPGHWHTAGVGMRQDGRPTIYVQNETGEVLHRQDAYRGPEALAGAVRKVDPAYDASRDPDANAIANPLAWLTGLDLKKIPPIAWIVGGVGAFLLWRTVTQKEVTR